MGWFDEQIRQRIEQDEQNFAESFDNMAEVVMGKKNMAALTENRQKQTQDAMEEILRYYHVKVGKIPDTITDAQDALDYLLRPCGIMKRRVQLSDGWYKDSIGPLLCQTMDGGVVAALPKGLSGYTYFDYSTAKRVKLNRRTEENLTGEAFCFYKPLPLRALNIKDLIVYMLETLSPGDFVLVGLGTLAVTLIGLLLPYVNGLIFDQVIPSGEMSLLMPIGCMLIGITLSTLLIQITKDIIMGRISTKTDVAVEAAAMMRTISLPAAFFKKYSAGELSSRIDSIKALFSMISDAVLSTGLTSIFSLIYIGQIFRYAPALVVPALAVVLATVVLSIGSSLLQMKVSRERMERGAKNNGIVFSLIMGIQKIKLAGAEKRAFSKWAKSYTAAASLQYNPPAFIKFSDEIVTAISLIGTIVIYYFAVVSKVSVANYMAFNVSYGMVSGAFASLAGVALTAANIKPVLQMVEPLLKTVPEVAESKRMITRLSGGVELNNVSFRYNPDMPNVLDDLSIKIKPGQYVAIVGKTGCGKSTLIRLLLGFEKPQKGAVYYDGMDIENLDLQSLRRHIGVVLQDGQLFQGDVFSNITISAPNLTMEDAWSAAEMAGIAEDIRRMPMGMHTLVVGGSGISGGQAQRLMIARAVAPKPRILIFDEATSALDNITQRAVSDALDALKCTRIVVAHRLSTIRHCNRILVLDGGKVVQDGAYEELISDKNGMFYTLVKRQTLDINGEEN